jgi:hypothetical protein
MNFQNQIKISELKYHFSVATKNFQNLTMNFQNQITIFGIETPLFSCN